jgi:Xaa-Pro aminopeptidase
MDLAGFQPRPFAARRDRLAAQLADHPALVASGTPRPRNYAANTFPFRASSHFLYLFGLPLRGAYGLWDGQGWTLYAPAPAPDDPLWHGPEPSLAELQAALGCPVRPTEDLPAALAGRKVATIPAVDLETCAAQAALLRRPVQPGVLEPVDLPLADALIALRLVHDDHAIGELRAAAAATQAAHRAGMKATRPGLRESNVRAAMEAELIARGMTVAYGSIVTVHGEVLHSDQHHHVLAQNDLLLADVGAETAGGWAGDVTRTWPVSGQYSSTQRDLYDVVLAAQQETIRAVKPGVRYRDLHLLASRRLAEGLVALGILAGDPQELVADGVTALLFPHGIGHLLGLDVHDMEDLGDRAGYQPGRTRAQEFGIRYLRLDRDLAAGMALTIEPGLYIVPAILEDPELGRRTNGRLRRDRLAAFADVRGIRIEDDVLVTASGNEVLTAAIPKTREAVESEMR